MAVFLGGTGHVKLRRGSSDSYGSFTDVISPDDVNTTLNRLSFESVLDNLLTGDRLTISTDDSRGLVCFAASTWSSNTIEDEISAYIHVNQAGGLRFFADYADAINNNRAAEITLTSFTGAPIAIDYAVTDIRFNVLGNVTGYTLNTDRDAIDVTSLNDKFRRQFNAGLISGNGSIDCLFDYETTGIKEPPLLMLQLIQRIEIGSQIELALYITDSSLDSSLSSVFYQTSAVITRTGINVTAQEAIECTIDFVTDGEIRLLIGEPSGFILLEDDDRIQVEQSLDYLLKEIED